MRTAFVNALIKIGRENDDFHLFTADLGYKLFDDLRSEFPHNFTNVGVAESNMIGVAAGMALSGTRVYCYSMVPFLIFRTLDQIRADVCAMNVPVTLVGVGAGITYGMEGMTHHAIEDIAVTRCLPGIMILSPGDPFECASLIDQTHNFTSPIYLRLTGNNTPCVSEVPYDVQVGKLSCLKNSGAVAIIATSDMLRRAKAVSELLEEKSVSCRLYSAHTIKPFDDDVLSKISRECRCIVSVENHSVINGLGTLIAEKLFENRYSGIFMKFGLPDMYATILGSSEWLYDSYGLAPECIAQHILEKNQKG